MSAELGYPLLINLLKSFEVRIFAHARLNQVESVESFLDVLLLKSKLKDNLMLAGHWDEKSIKAQTLYIVISSQNEIPNMPHVDALYDLAILQHFKHLKFLKYIENGPTDGSNITMRISDGKSEDIILDSNKLEFSMAKCGRDQYGRTIQIVVYVDQVIDTLLTPSPNEDYFIPHDNLLYMLDLVIGEYYMTKHISRISFAPRIIMPKTLNFITNAETLKNDMNLLLGLTYDKCSKCFVSSYRVNVVNGICFNCKE